MNNEDLGDQADKLGVKVDDLGLKVDRQTKALEELAERQTRTERVSTRTAVAVAAAIAILVAAAWLGYQQVVTVGQQAVLGAEQQRVNDQLAGVIAEQRRVIEESFCPVFSLLIGGYDPSTRPEGPARDAYVRTYETFRKSYDALHCTGQLVPPRTPGS
jgi:hypothetical protein